MKLQNQKDHKWNQWFAGLIDADGYFYINQKKEISFELTTHISDARIVYNIKNQLKAGSVKEVEQKQTKWNKNRPYRVKQRAIIIDIVHRINGPMLHNQRPVQSLLIDMH